MSTNLESSGHIRRSFKRVYFEREAGSKIITIHREQTSTAAKRIISGILSLGVTSMLEGFKYQIPEYPVFERHQVQV
jgi:hypothetical protein